jgi:hypothetical protein
MVHIYTIGYMHDDDRVPALLQLHRPVYVCHADAGHEPITSCNCFSVGKVVGLVSYLLIGFWYKREESAILRQY